MEKEIGRIKKNDMADIVVRVDDFGGKRGLTIREFIKGDRYTGFTKSGVRILPENFRKFKDMINSVKDEDMEESAEEEKGQKKPGEAEDSEEIEDY
jgi:hypothetical protein